MGKEIALFPSAAKAMAALDRLTDEIENAPSLESVEAIANAAAGYQRMYKPISEVADRAGEVWVVAETKIGAERAKQPKATGRAGPGRGKAGAKAGPAFNDAATLKEIGLEKKRTQRAVKLAAIPIADRNYLIEQLKIAGKGVTPAAVLNASRQAAKAEKHAAALVATFSATGPFDVVVIDPPWPMQKIDRDDRPNQDAFDYPVMTIDELATFWPEKIAANTTENVHAFVWTTQKYLPAALELLEKWDLRYVLTMVWHKPGGFQPVGLPQYNAEFIIYARKGSPPFIDTTAFDVCNSWDRREHSRKPAEFYELIKRVTGGSRLDVFAREAHDGFAQYGNETTKFDKAA
jgi:N6-adenosine-specific RNA methylase IME4